MILEFVGGGAVGVVLSAYDPYLDRRVAVKVLRPDVAAREGPEARERLLREARALGRLTHPNVLTVHDVGAAGEHVYIATEYADGGTLSEWCAKKPRGWREILRLYREAGKGLAAAHEAGLVHRDFKPANVLLTKDGAVRVADFGLVGLLEAPESRVDGAPRSESGEDAYLTRTGAQLGTPAYMAPEQFDGADAAGPPADQFSFCVCLYEALYGERPFDGATPAEINNSVLAGRMRPEPTGSGVPPWLRRVLMRGLKVRPEERYPSMSALLEVLAADPGARRRQIAGWVAALGAFAVVGTIGVWAGSERGRQGAELCQGMDALLSGTWDPERRAAVKEAFGATGLAYADRTFAAVAGALDEKSAAWVHARVRACEATHKRGDQSEALLDLRMQCLDRRLGEMRALVKTLTTDPDAKLLARAPDAVAQMVSPTRCDDTEALRAVVPRPTDPTSRVQLLRIEEALSEARALDAAGRYEQGLARAEAVLQEAESLGWQPLIAEGYLVLGNLQHRQGKYESAAGSYQRAALAAAEAHDDVLAAQAWILQHQVTGVALQRKEEADVLGRVAEAAAARIGRPIEMEAMRLRYAGGVASVLGRNEEALELERKALVLREAAGDADSTLVGASNRHLGIALAEMGRHEEAAPHMQRALDIYLKRLGAEHPKALDARISVAYIAALRGQTEEALAEFQTIVEIRSKVQGPEHFEVSQPLNNVGHLLLELERPQEALDPLERALAIQEKTLGADHAHLGYVLTNLSRAKRDLMRYDEAMDFAKRGLAIREKAYGAAHPKVGESLLELAQVELARGRHGAARATAERAIDVLETSKADPLEAAWGRFVLARALRAQKRSPARVKALAEEAHEQLREVRPREAAEVAAFLAQK